MDVLTYFLSELFFAKTFVTLKFYDLKTQCIAKFFEKNISPFSVLLEFVQNLSQGMRNPLEVSIIESFRTERKITGKKDEFLWCFPNKFQG